jgi:hypothetical protein
MPSEPISSSPAGWTYGGLVYVPGEADSPGNVILLAFEADKGRDGKGSLEIHPVGGGVRKLREKPPASVPLSDAPLAMSVIPNAQRVAVLCESAGDNLRVIDVARQETVLSTRVTAPTELVAQQPSGLSAGPSGQYLFVLLSGFTSRGSSGEGASTLCILDAATLEPVAPPLGISGRAIDPSKSTRPTVDGLCWIVTRDTGSNFAYVTAVRFSDGQLETVVESPKRSIRHVALLEPPPSGNGVALGLDNRLEVWPENRPGGAVAQFDAPIGSIAWNAETLLVGEGGRIHRIDPTTALSEQRLQLQTGIVADILPPDPSSGADRAVSTPAPILRDIPGSIWLWGEAAGQELKGFRIDLNRYEGFDWNLRYDQDASPWLLVYPLSGTTPATIHMAVYPERYTPSNATTQASSFRLRVESGTGPASTTLAVKDVAVHVTSHPNELRRILWIWPTEDEPTPLRSRTDPYGLKRLADLLAAPPHLFAHTETWDPIAQTPESYTVVVIDIRAAAEGTLTRSSLLDYVARGGSLLLLGNYLTENEASVLAQWLSPIDVRVKGGIRVDGQFPATSGHELALRWSNFKMRDGCVVQVDRADAVLAKGSEPGMSAVFAQVSHGLGRVAILAAPTPLKSQALSTPENHRFASELFEWLARARYEIDDIDSDGLTNATEDRNGNGVVDLGETDMFNADTDGDGLPDGGEDTNRNGWFDRGETSFLNADTDGDGIQDGADATPLPEGSAPFVSAVEMTEPGPLEAPAEGGDFVTIHGGNFTLETAVWFGDQAAPRVRKVDEERLIATTPPHVDPKGGTVRVRVVNQTGQQEGALPLGFQYTPISQVEMELKRLGAAADVYAGTLSLNVNAPGVSLGEISFDIEAAPKGSVHILGVDPGQGANLHEKALSVQPYDMFSTHLTLSSGNRVLGLGEAVRIRWKLTRGLSVPSVSFHIANPTVRARNGVALPVTVHKETIHYADPTPKKRPRAN